MVNYWVQFLISNPGNLTIQMYYCSDLYYRSHMNLYSCHWNEIFLTKEVWWEATWRTFPPGAKFQFFQVKVTPSAPSQPGSFWSFCLIQPNNFLTLPGVLQMHLWFPELRADSCFHRWDWQKPYFCRRSKGLVILHHQILNKYLFANQHFKNWETISVRCSTGTAGNTELGSSNTVWNWDQMFFFSKPLPYKFALVSSTPRLAKDMTPKITEMHSLYNNLLDTQQKKLHSRGNQAWLVDVFACVACQSFSRNHEKHCQFQRQERFGSAIREIALKLVWCSTTSWVVQGL